MNYSVGQAVATTKKAMATTCTDTTTTQNYATAKFHNLTAASATFVSTSPACGNKVTGSVDYRMDWIFVKRTITLSAAACFPNQSATAT